MDGHSGEIETESKLHIGEIRKHVQKMIAELELDETDPHFEMQQIC